MRILVLGLGNILLSDEGVGVRVAEALSAQFDIPDSVEVVDGGTSGMDLMNTVAGCDCLIVVDAVKSEEAPGTVARFAGDRIDAFFKTRLSPHQLGLSDLLATLQLMDEAPSQVVLIGIVPEDLSLGTELSETACRARDFAVLMVVRELAVHGVSLAAYPVLTAEVA